MFFDFVVNADVRCRCVKSFKPIKMLGCHTGKDDLEVFRQGLALNVACIMNVNRMLTLLAHSAADVAYWKL